MATEISPADLIRQKMRRIRHLLDDDVQGVKENASRLMDYSYYLNNYPWTVLFGVSLLGYYFAPRRKVEPKVELAPEQMEQLMSLPDVLEAKQTKKKPGWKSQVFRSIMNTALSFAVSSAVAWADHAIAHKLGSHPLMPERKQR